MCSTARPCCAPSMRRKKRSAPSPSSSTMPASRKSVRALDMTEEEWRRMLSHRSRRGVLLGAGRRAPDAGGRQAGRDRQYRLGAELRRLEGRRGLRGRQGRRRAAHQGAGAGTRLQGRAGQCDRAGLVRHRNQRRIPLQREGPGDEARDPDGSLRRDGDLDGTLLLLVSKAGGYITGATIVVDGGQVVALA